MKHQNNMEYISCVCLLCVAIFPAVSAQGNPFNMAQMLQRQTNDLLQQTMLQNMRNQASMISSMDRGFGSSATNLLDQIPSHVASSLSSGNNMPNTNVGASPNIVSSLRSVSNMIPMDNLMRQQQNLHAQMLQNMFNAPRQRFPTEQQPSSGSRTAGALVPGGRQNQRGSTVVQKPTGQGQPRSVVVQLMNPEDRATAFQRNAAAGRPLPGITSGSGRQTGGAPQAGRGNNAINAGGVVVNPSRNTEGIQSTGDVSSIFTPFQSSVTDLTGNNTFGGGIVTGMTFPSSSVSFWRGVSSSDGTPIRQQPQPWQPQQPQQPLPQPRQPLPQQPQPRQTQPQQPRQPLLPPPQPRQPLLPPPQPRQPLLPPPQPRQPLLPPPQPRQPLLPPPQPRQPLPQPRQPERDSGIINRLTNPGTFVVPDNPAIEISRRQFSEGGRSPTSPAQVSFLPIIVSNELSCSGDYSNIPGHTMCLTDNADVTRNGVSDVTKQVITKYHNDLRSKVQPPAADLLKLKWDDRLASVSEKWAKQCILGHDGERSIPGLGMSVGQNVAVGYDSWEQAIQQWYDEFRLYRYGFDPDSYLGPEGWREVAHFTQIVQNGTYLVGCGYAECPNTEYIRFYVCNYAAGQTDLAYPYTAGTRCGSCPNNCNNGLCDCGNVVCQNKGTLDPNTCTCTCRPPYKGVNCEILDCPAEDSWICGRDWQKDFCNVYVNVPEECPYMCGLCTAPEGSNVDPVVTPVVSTPVLTNYTSSFGCTYTGIRDGKDTCRRYGENGADKSVCASEGGNVGCDQCSRYFNIKRDYCPVMCGLCDPPCDGLRCFNGGTLDSQNCTCQCRKPFTGRNCELAQCPVGGDPGFCRFWPTHYCQLYYNVPEECPYMCRICKADNPVVNKPSGQ